MLKHETFQPQDGGSIPTSPLHFNISKISHKQAKGFVENWHYSGRMPTGKNVNFGLWCNDYLYAVIVYGIGVNPYQAKFLGVDSVVEIKRMCRSEPKMNYELSRFIRLSLKMVGREMRFDAVVAFADPEQGHEGTVYKATGFGFAGKTNAEWHLVDKDGVKRHRRYAYRMARRNDISVSEARDILGVERVKTEPKNRWVLKYKSGCRNDRY